MRKNISETIREEMKDLYDAGLIDEITMRQFDTNSLEPAKEMSKQDVKRIRAKTSVSQPVFASYLNVTPAAVKQWEKGERNPSGASLRLLQLIDQDGLNVFQPIQKVSKSVSSQAVAHVRRSARVVSSAKRATSKGSHKKDKC